MSRRERPHPVPPGRGGEGRGPRAAASPPWLRLPWRGPAPADAHGDARLVEEGEGGGAPRLQGAAGRLEPPLVAEPPPPPAPSMVMAEPRRPPPLLPRGLGPVRVGFYDIEGTLGKGNFAVVKLARHRITRSEVRRDAAPGAAVSPCPGLARPRRRGSPASAGPRSAGRWAAALGSPRGLEVGGGRRPECCGALLRTSEGAGRRGSARKGGTGLPFGAQSGHWPLGCGAPLGSRAFPGGWLGGSAGPCSSALAGCLLLLSLLALEPPPVGEARAPLFTRGAGLRAGFGAGALAAVLVCFLAFIFLARAEIMSPSPVPPWLLSQTGCSGEKGAGSSWLSW